jgi:hypothetical protein
MKYSNDLMADAKISYEEADTDLIKLKIGVWLILRSRVCCRNSQNMTCWEYTGFNWWWWLRWDYEDDD